MSDKSTELGTSVLDDDELLQKAKNAENGRKFGLLFEKGWNSRAVNNAYEKPRHARLALLSHLAWWTRHDTGQMWRLFQRSALCPGELATYREYFVDLVRSALTLLGDECYEPNYGQTSAGETQ